MKAVSSKLTILFEDPFWIGIFERETKYKYEVSRIVFGSEPKDYQVYEFIQKRWNLLKFSQSIKLNNISEKNVNPKRLQRMVKKQTENVGIGTKAQQALKLQYEQSKIDHKADLKEKKQFYKEQQYELRQEKSKEKHKGH